MCGDNEQFSNEKGREAALRIFKESLHVPAFPSILRETAKIALTQ